MRTYFESGITRPYHFRKQQLILLQQTIKKYEKEINEALFTDLKKNAEEAYIGETGLIYAEIKLLLKRLKKWMKPQTVGTDMLNFPSASKIYRDPLGVVLIIAPWNYPFQLSLLPLVGAIAGGNCVVLKPSEFAPASTSVIQKIIHQVFPAEYVLVAEGDGAAIIPAMTDAFRFDHIFYTGSIPVGKAIYASAAKNLIPVTLELGGKSPAIVEADADIKVAAKRIITGKFLNAGQTCIAPDYVLVNEEVKQQLVERMAESILSFYGSNAEESYEYGKIINERRFDKLVSYLQEGEIITGGKFNREKLYISPTILHQIKAGAAIMQDEIFGPLLPVISYKTTGEAIEIVKQHANPLALYLFTASNDKQQQWIANVPFGGGCINNTVMYFSNHRLPFGGVGNSGIGAYHGKYTFNVFTRLKPVMKSPVWFDLPIKYPPFKGKLNLFKMFKR